MKNAWRNMKLGEVATLQRGFDLPTQSRVQGEYPLISSSGISDSHNVGIVAGPGVATGRSGSIGNVFFVEEDFWPLNTVLYVKDFHGNDPRFIYYLLQRVDLSRFASGTGVPTLNRNVVHDEAVAVPPLPEQRRIAALLDVAFQNLETAQANVTKNLKGTSELTASVLNELLSHRDKDWQDKTLGAVCSIARGGSPRPIQSYLTNEVDGVNWVKISDATASSKYIYRTEQKIRPEGVSSSRLVHEGDFLLSNSMSFGRPYIMKTTGCIHDGWLVLSNYSKQLDQDYLYYVLSSQLVFRQFDRLAAGSTVRNLNKELASQVVIPVPPMRRQKEIVARLDSLVLAVDQLRIAYRQKFTHLKELKESLLEAAFSGKLEANRL